MCGPHQAQASASGGLRVQALGSVGVGAQAEDRQADGAQLRGVAVQPPDDDPDQAGARDLERDEVADAGLVGAALVVHDEHVAGLGMPEGLEEHVDAADVPHRPGPPDDVDAGPDRAQRRRRAPDGDAEPQARVGDVRGGQVLEQCRCVHVRIFAGQTRACSTMSATPSPVITAADVRDTMRAAAGRADRTRCAAMATVR